jgi:exopolysaccharide production protein ExoY
MASSGEYKMYDAIARDGMMPSSTEVNRRQHTSVPGGAVARFFDICIALAALIFTAPLLITVALLVKLEDGGPIVFGHGRIGRDGVKFKCLKFRSMCTDADVRLRNLLASDAAAREEWALDQKLRNDPRITRIGQFIRTWSLDELPQLWNVLRGEMSIVGPRPIVDAEVERYGRHFRHYKSPRPGITGMWQVFGRNDVSYRQRVVLDVYYARNQSLGLYLKILFMTVPAVLLKKGSY